MRQITKDIQIVVEMNNEKRKNKENNKRERRFHRKIYKDRKASTENDRGILTKVWK